MRVRAALSGVVALLFGASGCGLVPDRNSVPVAYFEEPGVDPRGPTEYLVSFDGSKSTDDSDIVSYTWDFNDGSPPVRLDKNQDGAKTTHRYLVPNGSFTVTLLVTDDDGEESPPFPRRFSLKPNQPPVADFERTPDNGPAPLIVKFTTTSTDPDPDDASSLRFSWDFGDNQPGSTVTTTSKTYDYVYKSRGEYFVRLIASDGRLESSPVIKTVSVR